MNTDKLIELYGLEYIDHIEYLETSKPSDMKTQHTHTTDGL